MKTFGSGCSAKKGQIRKRSFSALGLVLLNLAASMAFAQQIPPGCIAYTKYSLRVIDHKELG